MLIVFELLNDKSSAYTWLANDSFCKRLSVRNLFGIETRDSTGSVEVNGVTYKFRKKPQLRGRGFLIGHVEIAGDIFLATHFMQINYAKERASRGQHELFAVYYTHCRATTSPVFA